MYLAFRIYSTEKLPLCPCIVTRPVGKILQYNTTDKETFLSFVCRSCYSKTSVSVHVRRASSSSSSSFSPSPSPSYPASRKRPIARSLVTASISLHTYEVLTITTADILSPSSPFAAVLSSRIIPRWNIPRPVQLQLQLQSSPGPFPVIVTAPLCPRYRKLSHRPGFHIVRLRK